MSLIGRRMIRCRLQDAFSKGFEQRAAVQLGSRTFLEAVRDGVCHVDRRSRRPNLIGISNGRHAVPDRCSTTKST